MIGVIADDLSGAAELGAIGWRQGLRAEIVFDGHPSGKADLVCVDSDSRLSTPDEAASRALAAVRLLTAAGAGWIYKKVDSVLRGRITAELQALLKELCLPLTLLCPANPSLGRVIRNGRYFVRGIPLDETEFARDPHYPRFSANVRELLSDTAKLPVQVCHLHDPLPASGIAVAQAETSEDLQAWAARLTPGILPAGAAEFFAALLAAKVPRVSASKTLLAFTFTPQLFVCGSTSDSSRQFIESARESRVPIFSLPAELTTGLEFDPVLLESLARSAVAALATHPRVILRIGLPLVHHQAIAAKLAVHLADLAARVLESANVAHIFTEGGGTAAALMRRMRRMRLTVLQELAPGVATLGFEADPKLRLTLKPGSYLWPESVQRIPC